MSAPRFTGGPIFLNSGGTGPDDYLVKPVRGGRWVRVIRRSGRHFTGDPDAAASDRAAWSSLLPLKHVCVPDNFARWLRGKDRIPTMNATEFAAKYASASGGAS